MDNAKRNKLFELAVLCQDEYGEYLSELCSIINYKGYGSEQFFKALEKEMDDALKNFKENAEIIETVKKSRFSRTNSDGFKKTRSFDSIRSQC